MVVRLHRRGAFPHEDFDLRSRSGSHGYIDPHDLETMVIVDVPSIDKDAFTLYRFLNHESLHIAFNRMSMFEASGKLDLFIGEGLLSRKCLIDMEKELWMLWLGF